MAALLTPVRARLPLELSLSRLCFQVRTHLNVALQTPSPASLEIETMPYPTTNPDDSVFESMSEEYTFISTDRPHHFPPLSSSEKLASLVSAGDFQAAKLLCKEMNAHHVPIPRNVLYLRAALHAIKQRRVKGSFNERLEAFEAWLSLVPDRHEEWQSFHDIRQRLFRSMDHLNLTLTYRFGLVLASKGYYSGDAARQVASTLARYAPLSVVEKYLRQLEDASRNYHAKSGTIPPSDSLANVYNLSVRTVALTGGGEAALRLISLARSRGITVSDFTLNIVAKHAPDRQVAIDRIQVMYPSWSLQDTNTHPVTSECGTLPSEHTTDIAVLATRLRSLRIALRSHSPPSPHALHSFVTSYQALGRTRGVTLLRTLAYRHSPKSASTWAFTEMLHHRSRGEANRLLFVFSQHFYPVGIPRKTLFSLIRGRRGQQAQKERTQGWVAGPSAINEKLWPTAYHTALVWEAIVSLSPNTEKERLYALLLSLVRQSKCHEQGSERALDSSQTWSTDRIRLQLLPDTFDAAHFSPFVSGWSRRRLTRAAAVLQDMVDLGVQPSLIQWSMVARGYAQHDEPCVALRILDRLEDLERRKDGDGSNAGGSEIAADKTENRRPSDMLLGVHTNVLRGFVAAGDASHAREVEARLVERFGYQVGDRPATDVGIALLRALEERLCP